MPGGGATTQPRQTTTTKMSPQQRQIWQWVRPDLRNWAKEPPALFPGTGIVGFNDAQRQGQNMAINAAGAQRGLASGGLDANQFLLGDIWNPQSNPALQGAINASIRPITEQYQEVVRPAIADEFQAAGQQFGGSRRGVAEGIAGGRYLDAVGDTSSKLVQDQYGNNLNAMVRGLGLLPQTLQAQLAPALTVSGVGDVRQRLAQARLNEDVGNWNYGQNAGFLQSKDLLNILSGLPGGTSVSTANNPPQPPWWQQSLGGASMGMSMGSMFGPWGAPVGAGIGALLPFLS